ncbi:MAG TPA: diacylglycerol kinase family protein [Gaiellales bacterium]
MSTIAVIAHAGKSIEGGLPQLRRTLATAGVDVPIWYEVPKSRKAPKQVRRALKQGADLLIVWGGDGMVQRCIDAMAGSDVTLAIVPAGTANLFASNLGIPKDIEGAVRVALSEQTRAVDVGRMNGERFVVMAGAGFDAEMIRSANGGLKDRLGRVAYVVTGARAVRSKPFRATVNVDGSPWFTGRASCVLVGNVGALFGGVTVFADAEPDDGMVDLGVITADGLVQWARTAARTAVGSIAESPFAQVTKGRTVKVKLDRKVRYQLDGGDRAKARKFRIDVQPASVHVRVPAAV